MEPGISRREFGKRLARVASGAALFALQPSCRSIQPSRPVSQLLRDDLAGLSGTLLLDDPARNAAADDFGHIVRRLPIAVLKPGSAEDVVKLVQFANRHGLKIAMRGAGHAMFGDTQVDGGVVIDTSTLNSVRVMSSAGRRIVEAGPGVLWGAVWDATYAEKLTPPVNVDTGVLSVGGTVSTGGFGGTSWRQGLQVDHVLELQVVTGYGELVTCSDERNSDLFNAALAGMGQCGVIVKVLMELVAAPTHVHFFVLSYPDLPSAIADLTLLVRDGRYAWLDGRTTARPGGGFTYNLEAGAFYDAPEAPGEEKLLSGLRFTSQTGRVMTYPEFYRRVAGRLPPLPHPWLYLCVPASRFVEYATGVFASPAESAFAAPRFSVWRRESIKRPLARVPNEDLIARFQLSRNPPASADVASLVAMNRSLYERAREMGGTRLTTSAIPFSQVDWSQHYGSVWESFRSAKKRFDPNNVLAPSQGMFPS
jgi:cytokinin dehydrogenase